MRFGLVIFAQRTVGRRAGHVEISQCNIGEFRIGGAIIAQDPLDAPFRPAVRIDRRLAHGFDDGRGFRLAVGGAGRTEHQPLDARLLHGLQKADRAGRIVVVVAQRFGDRLAHVGQGGKVHHAVDGMFGQGVGQGLGFGQVDFQKVGLGMHGLGMSAE